MKKLYAVNLCVLAMMFLTAGVAAKPDTDRQQIENLIASRIDILNDYYSGAEDAHHTGEGLEAIEKDRLLRQDTALMEACQNTEVEPILKADIDIKTCRRTAYDMIKGEVKITYVLAGYAGRNIQTGAYFYTAEQKGEKIMLTQLKNIE